MRTEQLISIGVASLLILGVLIGLYKMVFNAESLTLRFSSPMEWLRYDTGGIVINKTSHPLIALDWRRHVLIEPGKSSRDMGLQDADGVVLTQPTQIDGQQLTTGVLKVCNFGTLTLTEANNNEWALQTNWKTLICKLIGDYKLGENIETVFPTEEPY